MAADSQSRGHESYMKLAETGRHQEALEHVRAYLRDHPQDPQAWNDCGAILYCLRQIEDAIVAFEKARNLSGDSVSAEIFWNLSEAYLDGGYPGMAVKQFDIMEKLGLLSADILNRTADAFLKQESFGGAVEMLLRSLEINPQQEILQPMLEIVRTKRPRLAIFAASEEDRTKAVYDYARKRFPTELHVGKRAEEIGQVSELSRILWFEGCGDLISALSQTPRTSSVILRLRPGDVLRSQIHQIHWEQIHTVIVTGLKSEYESLLETVEGIAAQTRVVYIPDGVDNRDYGSTAKQRGKNLAYIGPLTAEANPMFLLQCMQKLNYLDPSYRLYFVGSDADAGMESYLRHMIDQMRLSGVVVMDQPPRNLNMWLRDKHYIVAAGIQGQGWEGILKGMAAGLRPVVANYPGVDQRLEREFVFDLAEDFCYQIQSGSYEPQRYREMVESRFSLRTMIRAWNDELYRMEKDLEKVMSQSVPQEMAPPLLAAQQRNESSDPGQARVISPIMGFEPISGGPDMPFQSTIPTSGISDTPPNPDYSQFFPLPSVASIPSIPSKIRPVGSPAAFNPSWNTGYRPADPPSEVIPIMPIQPVNLNLSPEALQEPAQMLTPAPSRPEAPTPPAHISIRKQRSVDELAKEALKASQALAELAKRMPSPAKNNSEIGESLRPTTLSGNPFGSFQDTAQENHLIRTASEFSDHPISLDIPGAPNTTNGEPTIPFSQTWGR